MLLMFELENMMDKLPPEKIYLQWNDSDPDPGVTWCQDKINDDDLAQT